jgi:hypothetical protein
MALLFIAYVNYVPFHLLKERHLDDALSSAQLATVHFDDHDDAEHEGHDEHHKPHPSSEHFIQILSKSESVVLCIALPTGVAGIVLDAPESLVKATFVERIWPPGTSPPEPSQPRAPPLV